jgi:magnesium transporter
VSGDGDRLHALIKRMLDTKDEACVGSLLERVHAVDIAHLIDGLPIEHQVVIVRLIPRERAADVLSELNSRTLLALVGALEEVEVSGILERMPADHAAEVVEELSPDHAEKVLDLMPEAASEEIQGLLEYPEDTAGRLMSRRVVALPDSATVGQALEQIRKSAPEGRGFEVYVVDDYRHLVGIVPLRRLLTADLHVPLSAIQDRDVVRVQVDLDQEDVARVVAKYDLVAVAVVDRDGSLVGTIAVEDVIDIIKEEASEDIFRLAGSDAAELERRPPTQIALMRLPWIVTTLAIELVAGIVIHHYDATLSRVILLASFMPIIQAISGNTGLQSVTMVVRGLATGDVQLARWWEPLWRQLQTTLIIGAACGAIVGAIGFAWHGTLTFGAVVATSMFVSVNLSGIAGTGFPMLSKRCGFDPALTAGPFETAFQDVIGVTVFLSLATALLHWLAT